MSLAFVLMLYDDVLLAERLIRQLRQWHPNADILAIADGVTPDGFAAYCTLNTVTYVPGDRLKPRTHGGQWTQRYLELFLARSDATTLIKLDPDSFVYRAIANVPDSASADLFGTLRVNHLGQTQVRGGCVGYQRAAAQRLMASKLLLEDKYRDATRYSYRRKPEDPLLTLQDAIVADVAQRLELKLFEWSEVAIVSGSETPVDNAALTYAVTHPHKS